MKTEQEKLEKELLELKDKLDTILKENGSLTQAKEDFERQLRDGSEKLSNLEEEAKQKEQLIASLKEEKARAESDAEAQTSLMRKMEDLQSEKPDIAELRKLGQDIKDASAEMKASIPKSVPGVEEANKAQEELNRLNESITNLKTRNAELETKSGMLEEQNQKLGDDITRLQEDLKGQMETFQKNNKTPDEVSNMSNKKLEKMNGLNSVLKKKNVSLDSSIREILKRLDMSFGTNEELKKEVMELSESIENMEFIEVDDFIDTIRAIDDETVKKRIQGEICDGKATTNNKNNKNNKPSKRRTVKRTRTTRTRTRASRKVTTIGRPKGSKNSYQRKRKTLHQLSMNQRRRNKTGGSRKKTLSRR
jgi:chromosome segregation ATPase